MKTEENEQLRVPLGVSILVLACCAAVFASRFVSYEYVSTTESAFVYDVNSGKPVNPQNNPLAQFGPRFAVGLNSRWFVVDSQLASFAFGDAGTGGSKQFDDALEWNSEEGLGMKVNYKIFGQVQDAWRFYLHYGRPEHDYDVRGIDPKIYEALRHAGKKLDEYVNNYAATKKAEDLRSSPDTLRAFALAKTQEFMAQFGFQVTDVLFTSNFSFTNGDLVQKARQQITEVNTEIAQEQQNLQNETTQYKIDFDQAKIDADNVIAAANRQASNIRAETDALANAMSQAVEQVGIDGAVQLFVVENFGDLIGHGVIPLAVVGERSVFASPFYPPSGGTATPKTARAPAKPAPPVLSEIVKNVEAAGPVPAPKN